VYFDFISLVFLCSEYSSQLPSDGGTFYHPDTIDSAKPHYKKRWTPILHALAIWLHETGFSVGEMNKESDKNSNVPANAPANMKRNEINSDRLYLILGTVHLFFVLFCFIFRFHDSPIESHESNLHRKSF
jgi:hypothetical protein